MGFLYRSFVCVYALLIGTFMYILIGIFNVHTNRVREKRVRDERGGRERGGVGKTSNAYSSFNN